MPNIGITSSAWHNADGTVHEDMLPYLRAIERAGGSAVLLENDPSELDELLSTLGGVLVTGGVDVDPARYGGRREHSHSAAGRYQPQRDAFEIALVNATRELRIPTLCICRGIQIANVAFGGTLIEDVRDELGERYTINHRQTYENGLDRADYAPGHDVKVDTDSGIARLAGATSFRTNSMHHQALRVLGNGFVAVGHTPDGIIEAVDPAFEHPFFYGVQWHPEELDDDVSRRIFSGLVRSAESAAR